MTELLQRLLNAASEMVSDVALEWAAERDVLPSGLSSRDQREAFSRELRGKSVFSARTSSAGYLQEIKDVVDLAMAGGYENDLPNLRLALKQSLARLGYTPETGFPGDDDLAIPPAEPGSLKDLSSGKRIDFILETQISLARGAGQRQRGLDPGRMKRWPAWELIRVYSRRVPRGSEPGSLGWAGRWLRAEGPVVPSGGRPGGRLIALKDDLVWRGLGSKELFDDALDVDHPPFAFNSGLRWVEVSRDESEALGLMGATSSRPVAPQEAGESLPTPESSLRGLDPALREKLRQRIRAERGVKPDHVRYNELLEKETREADDAYAKRPRWVPPTQDEMAGRAAA